MKKTHLSKAIAFALAGTALTVGSVSTASAATTMYNLYNNNGTTPCSPCLGPANPLNSFTDGWVWGLPTAASNFIGPTSGGNPNAATPGWVGTSGSTTTPFGAYTAAPSLNWGFRLNSGTDSGQISNADAIARYSVSADIDTAAGAWFDNGATPQGWLHDLDMGLFRSDVSTPVSLSVVGIDNVGSNFGITVFKGMSTNTTGYTHHGSWNANQDGTVLPSGSFGGDLWGFTAADIVATTDTSGVIPINLNQLIFNADAGQIYTIAIGGWKDGAWYEIKDGYALNVAAVPVPGAIWLFGSALAGFMGYGRRNNKSAAVVCHRPSSPV
jgi:hypothetical protein